MTVNRIPKSGGHELVNVLKSKLQNVSHLKFELDGRILNEFTYKELGSIWNRDVLEIVAKPLNSAPVSEYFPTLRLVTVQGPDAGRLFPLSRKPLTVGRHGAQAQIHDPWIPAFAFTISLGSNGSHVVPTQGKPYIWDGDQALSTGSTSFRMFRTGKSAIRPPTTPPSNIIAPGAPPSKPNLVLQTLSALAPLIIGVVLMIVTGMWYFLLFSGLSFIIAGIMAGQYRSQRKKFIRKIRHELATKYRDFKAAAFEPHEMVLAASSPHPDNFGLLESQPEFPVILWGTGNQHFILENVSDDERWNDYLVSYVNIVQSVRPGECTFVVGSSEELRQVRHWCLTQLLRHVKATDTGIVSPEFSFGYTVTIELHAQLPAQRSKSTHYLIFSNVMPQHVPQSTTIVDLYQSTIRSHGGTVADDMKFLGVSQQTARLFAEEVGVTIPEVHQSSNALEILEHPMTRCSATELTATLSKHNDGFRFNLVEQGPHLMITGTTGSGKSELILTVLVGLAQAYPPAELSFILLDFKGGASFNVLAGLPHTMVVETNHFAATNLRSLDAIQAELLRREALFARYEVADYTSFRAKRPFEVLPRLIVAIDELRVLVDQNPDAQATLSNLAATGRSLGFHLLLATQRLQGAVDANLRSNMAAVICLRTATEQDSWDALGSSKAYQIPLTKPGRAYFKSGAEDPAVFQAGTFVPSNQPVVLTSFSEKDTKASNVVTDWMQIVDEVRVAAENLVVPQPVLLKALVNKIRVSDLALHTQNSPSYIPIGLADVTQTSQQYPVGLGSLSHDDTGIGLQGSVAWIGTPDSGIQLVIKTVCMALLETTKHKLLLDGQSNGRASYGTDWEHYLNHKDATPETLKVWFERLHETLDSGQDVTLVVTNWGNWSTAMVAGEFHGFEEKIIDTLRQYPQAFTLYVFGARELAGGRLVGMISNRFYLPKNSSPEHQLIWPTLQDVPNVDGRAIVVTADIPAPGLEVQLAE